MQRVVSEEKEFVHEEDSYIYHFYGNFGLSNISCLELNARIDSLITFVNNKIFS